MASAIYLFKGDRRADRIAVAAAELAVVFGLFGLVTGSLWGRKAWGVWWQWEPRLTTALMLELILSPTCSCGKYGGPGSEKLAAGVALFGLADAVIVYKAADWWRTHSSADHGGAHADAVDVTAPCSSARSHFSCCSWCC